LRRTGIPIVGDAPWGTHFCQFYQDQRDLTDILVLYFKAGLEDNEFCMWITSEPLQAEEAKAALAREVENFEEYLRAGQIEIVDYRQWYTVGGGFQAERVLRGWVEKLDAARQRGFDGLRLSGNTFWLEKQDWQAFTEYEAMVDGVIGRYPMLAICTYSLPKCGAAEIIDVVSNHSFALIKRAGEWRVLESTQRKKLDSILPPDCDLAELELGEIIDAPAIQSLMEEFHRLVNIPMAILDLKGKVLVGVGWQKICTKFHRVHSETCGNCMESDTQLTAGVPPGQVKTYKCKNGMWDVVTPLIVGGRHVGNLFLGQLFFDGERVDQEWFRSRARRYGFQEETYLAALEAVPRLSQETVDAGMAFLAKLGGILSQLSYSNIKLARALSDRDVLTASLKEGGDRLNRAQEIAHLGSWELDLAGNRLSWSDEVYRIFGLQPREFVATYEAFLEAVHPEDRAAVDAAYSDSVRDGRRSYEIQHRVVWRDGEVRWVQEKCEHLFDSGGRVMRSTGMVQDITERKEADQLAALLYHQARQEIARRQQVEVELRRSNEELEQFAFVISHDLRSPLNAVTSFANQLKEEFHGKLGEEADTYLSYLTGAAARMRRLISDLLAYSRVADDGEGKTGPILAQEAFQAAMLNLEEMVRDTRASITCESLPEVAANSGLLTHIFQNLLENAMKFRGEQPPRIHVAAEPQADGWRFCVSDIGIGIDSRHLEQIFRIFKRLHGDHYEGTGIGLAVCKKLVERQGGRIWVESEQGHGAKFYFTLPAAESAVGQAAGE
jgi:PAS domain S-box-containing protein